MVHILRGGSQKKTAKSAASRFPAEDGSLENVGAVQLVIASVNSGSY